MVQNKLDIRTLKTQSIIQETLKKILLNKDVKDITVYELCKEANINRGTFYNHYNNISEVYEVIFNDMFTSIQEKINKLNLIHFEDDDLIELLDLILNNKYIFENFIKSGLYNSWSNKIIDIVKEKYTKEIPSSFHKKDIYLDAFTFILYGAAGIIIKWANKNYKTSKEAISSELAFFINNSLKLLMFQA